MVFDQWSNESDYKEIVSDPNVMNVFPYTSSFATFCGRVMSCYVDGGLSDHTSMIIDLQLVLTSKCVQMASYYINHGF